MHTTLPTPRTQNPSTQNLSTQNPSTQIPRTQIPRTQNLRTQNPSTQNPRTQNPGTQKLRTTEPQDLRTPDTQTPRTLTPQQLRNSVTQAHRPPEQQIPQKSTLEIGALTVNTAPCRSHLVIFPGHLYGHPARILLDPGSAANFVSAQFVQQHHLPATTMDTPLVTTAFNGTLGTTNLELCQAPYQIGDLAAQADFYVSDLSHHDAILGMPWMEDFEQDILHYHWQRKQLTLQHQGRTITLEGAMSTQSATLVSAADITSDLKDLQDGEEVGLLFLSDACSQDTNTKDPALEQLLKEFQDVFPEDLPAQLPPPRDVDHHIDLVPGATPPSRPVRRMTQPEREELVQQLQYLLE